MLFLQCCLGLQFWLLASSENELPGLNYLISGFDALTMTSQNEVNKNDDSKFRLLDLSEMRGTEYSLKIGTETYRYSIPKMVQVVDVSLKTAVAVESITKTYEEFVSQYFRSYSFGFSIGIPIKAVTLNIMPGYHASLTRARDYRQAGYTASATSTVWWGMYKIQLGFPPLLKFDQIFNISISALAAQPTTEYDQELYNQVIVAFGTHYVSSVIVGGVAHLYRFISEQWQREHTQETTSHAIRFGLSVGFPTGNTDGSSSSGITLGGFNFATSWGNAMAKTFELFVKSSRSSYDLRPSLADSTDSSGYVNMSAWLAQVARQPVVVNRTLYPLSDLVKWKRPDVAHHLRSTIDFYLKYGELPKLGNIMRRGKSAKTSFKTIFGLNIVGCGLDILTLGIKSCLFNLNYRQETILNELSEADLSYRIPDGYSAKGTDQMQSNFETKIFKQPTDFIENMTEVVNQDRRTYLIIDSSLIHEKIPSNFWEPRNSRLNLAVTRRKVNWYSLKINSASKPSLNTDAEMMLMNLPKNFDRREPFTLWQNFFNRYGTHYVDSADFGGIVWIKNFVESCDSYDNFTDQVTAHLNRCYWPITTAEFNSMYRPDIDEGCLRCNMSKMKVRGGDEHVFPFELQTWLRTITRNPQAVMYRLLPIYYLLPLNSRERNALEQATNYFQEKETILQKSKQGYLGIDILTSSFPRINCSCFNVLKKD